MRRINYLGWGVLLFALILSGCGKLSRTGPEPVNIAPEVFFTNIPPESLRFSINPRIYWYGTDKDGFITAYQYAVIRDSVSELWGGLQAAKDSLERFGVDSVSWANGTARLDVFGVHVAFEKGHQRDVRMYAEMDPKDSTAQHVFLRAVDNKGGVSEIKTRMYWRNNHAPEAYIDVEEDFVQKNLYCLPDTTATWKGIQISWHGLDTTDYPDLRKQPDFYFRWELWGPYDTSVANDPDVPRVAFSLDSIEIEGEWFYDEWVLEKFHIFKDLENYSENDSDYGYGWYQLRVWSRDDAFVSSKKSATTFFRILKPLFRYGDFSRKTVLVLDQTNYLGDGRPKNYSQMRPFYETALSSLKGEHIDEFRIDSLGAGGIPSEHSLSRYDLVIALNLGRNTGISDPDCYEKYEDYLNVGGRLWLIGMNNWGMAVPGVNVLRSSFPPDYFGIESAFNPGYAPSQDTTLEFIAAEPFGTSKLPKLEMDTVKAKSLVGYSTEREGYNFPKNGIPHVSYEVLSNTEDFKGRTPYFRRLYSFVSRRGKNSIPNQMPCATTYIGSTFRTAEFTFPLNVMKDGDEKTPGAFEAFRMMVQWFLEDLPQP
jgi:hypothetical protein